MNLDNFPEDIIKRLKFIEKQSPGPKKPGRQSLIDEDEYNNPTLPKQLAGIIHEPKRCEDCGDTKVDRHIAIKKYLSPYPHWKDYCAACQKYKDPDTGTYTLDQYEIATYHRQQAYAINLSRKTNSDK